MLEFDKQVNAAIFDPAFTRRFDCFSRYGNGKIKPPLAPPKLFMVLDRVLTRAKRSSSPVADSERCPHEYT